MKKMLLALLFFSSHFYASECVCFQLEGEFGEEIKAILQKYSKNLGSKDIKVIREDADLSPQEQSFVKSLLGSTQTSSSQDLTKNLENGKKLFNRDCASCHGQNAEISVLKNPPIKTWKAQDIADELKSYQNQTFDGQSRFIKYQITQRYTKKDMLDIGRYIESLR